MAPDLKSPAEPAFRAPFQAWLANKLRAAARWKALGAVGCFMGGLLVLFVSFWVTYGVLWFLSRSFFRLRHEVLLLIAGGFMALVVLVGARQKPEEVELVDRRAGLARDLDVTLTPWNRFGISLRTDATRAVAFEIRSIATVVNYILCGGVLLIRAALGKSRELRRMREIDAAECARVIALLQARPGRQAFAEIVERLPGLNPVKVFDDLRWVEGVLFLVNEPPGLVLHPDLRQELNLPLNPAR